MHGQRIEPPKEDGQRPDRGALAWHNEHCFPRIAVFEHVRRLIEAHDLLTDTDMKPGFVFDGQRIPLIKPRRGIFKPQQMRFLLSIKTVFPKPGGKVWYDDQREVHRQIFEGDETIDYAFMGQDPTTDGFARRSRTRSRSFISSALRRDDTKPCCRPSSQGGTARL
jgi:hypothetical protein